MPTDFDWIFERDPYWRERSKEEALAVRHSHPTSGSRPSSQARRRSSQPGPKSNGEGEEVTVQEVIEAHPQPTSGIRDALVRCIDECFDCVATCTSCADACVGEQDVRELVRCICLNNDCADACDATGRILTRQTAPDVVVRRAAIQACAAACRACGEECERHAKHHEHCRLCARACRRCEQACNDLLAAIG